MELKIVCPILKGKRTGNGGDEGAAAHHRDRLIQNRESSLVHYTGEGMATSSILYYKVNKGEVNEGGRVAGMMMEEKEKVYFGERTCFCKSKSPGQPILAALDFWTTKLVHFPIRTLFRSSRPLSSPVSYTSDSFHLVRANSHLLYYASTEEI